MHVATPAPRDRQARPPVIPASVAAAQSRAAAVESKKKTEKDLQVLLCCNNSASFPPNLRGLYKCRDKSV